MKIFYAFLIGMTLLLTGCNGDANDNFNVVDTKDTQKGADQPSLKVDLKVEGTSAIVGIETDIVVSAEHYGLEKVLGEGHIHLYLDHGEKQGITSSPYIIEDLSKGKHEVRVSLHNNDHTPYGVSETVEFEIK
jgi:hypothetical protein